MINILTFVVFFDLIESILTMISTCDRLKIYK